MPVISVIIPSYNHAAFIGEAIESVLQQDYTDFELLIADDCSSDNSVEVIRNYQDKRIRSFFLTENLGATEILRFLITQARGTYIALLNSDDRWCPGKLTRQIAAMESHPECAACFTWADFIDEHGRLLQNSKTIDLCMFMRKNRTRYEWLNYFFYNGNCLCHPSVLIRKSVYETIGYYNGAYRQLPDFEYWVRLCASYPIHIIEEVLVNHRRTTGENENTSAVSVDNSKRSLSEMVSIVNWMFTNIDDETFRRAFQDEFLRKEASSWEELICEKYFLMSNNPVYGSVMKNQACQFYMAHYLNDAVARCFLEKYQYTQQKFYADNILSYGGFEQLFDVQDTQLKLYANVYYACRNFTHEKSFSTVPVLEGRNLKLLFAVKEPARMLRVDPIEGYGILVRSAKAVVNGKCTGIFSLNSQKYRSYDCFFTKDPQYILFGNFQKGDAVEIDLCVESILNYVPYRIQNGKSVLHEEFESTLKAVRQGTRQTAMDILQKVYIALRQKVNRFLKEF